MKYNRLVIWRNIDVSPFILYSSGDIVIIRTPNIWERSPLSPERSNREIIENIIHRRRHLYGKALFSEFVEFRVIANVAAVILPRSSFQLRL